ncbi:hypothetical protein M514_27299 [Trichuris suis]|uniref:Uncharacterized protein n=1 Tax=Trichuris suis TaxID=68888 RepID=A0A085MTG6_9BILA|nr:hypothetical protein M514_27297 [Trichuris suis]KFD60512.1 hypothetical protein M514_27299 [Trichuris suis]
MLLFLDLTLRLSSARSMLVNVRKSCTLRLHRVPRKKAVNVDLKPRFYLDPAAKEDVLPVFTPSGFLFLTRLVDDVTKRLKHTLLFKLWSKLS